MSEILKIETHDHISVLTLNRPEAMNALDYPLYAALEDAVRESEARCMIITGAGERAFCSGDDVKQILSKGAPSDESMAKRSQKTGGLTPAADALLHTDIPVIAAINGFALGWGAELAIMADIRVMADTAKFGEIFVKRGLCCDAPGLGRLAQLVGREQASELLFTGDIIDAARARRSVLSAASCHRPTSCRLRSGSPRRSPPTRPRPSRRLRRACAARWIRTGAIRGCGRSPKSGG